MTSKDKLSTHEKTELTIKYLRKRKIAKEKAKEAFADSVIIDSVRRNKNRKRMY